MVNYFYCGNEKEKSNWNILPGFFLIAKKNHCHFGENFGQPSKNCH
jgi:hypothetical protein